MKEYEITGKTVPLDDSYDVIVAGGGPAGCAAAAAAARAGAETLLIEAAGALGGMGTSGLVPAWAPFSDKEKMIYRGIAGEVFGACKAGMAHVRDDALDWVPIDSERLKRVYDDLVLSSGARVLFHTAIGAVDTDGNGNVTALIAASKAGLTAFRAKTYVDCTGDADVSAWAGAQFAKGDEETGELQSATHCFVLTNVDEDAYVYGENLHTSNPKSPVYAILRSGDFPEIIDAHCCSNLVGPNTVGFNAGHLENVDATDPLGVSRALVRGRKIAAAYRDALARYFPRAFANAFLVETAPAVGARESRRIVGDYQLCEEDYLARRSFPDEICRCSYYIDIHRRMLSGKDIDQPQFPRYGKGESFGLPYRCLTPRGLKNVLVAGRSISCTRALQGSTRVMPVCLAMGEAAGIAARMAAAEKEKDVDVHTVDTRRLRDTLRANGAYLP